MKSTPLLEQTVLRRLRQGVVIPAHPLALNSKRKLDERRQRALTRYYIDAGAGGVAVGVHTTQFEIHEPKRGLLRPVLELAAETLTAEQPKHRPPLIRVAGICGPTKQALKEARLAADLGYHAGLLSLSALPKAPLAKLIAHAKAVSEVIPLFGFYLQPAAGGRVLDFSFWRRFVEIKNVVAIKIAPFNRYQTLDVLRAVSESGCGGEIALYTGNDDHIIHDLLATFRFSQDGKPAVLRMVGGLLGQWAVWTRRAETHLGECHRIAARQQVPVPRPLLTVAEQMTDANGAIFDAAHNFAGCLPGIHEVLRRQGLLEGIWCLNPRQTLSPGQLDEIDRVHAAYRHLNDDPFVAKHIDTWLR
jgi:dihydrodipicolinate synthase/N-acetylneuraminate lyase